MAWNESGGGDKDPWGNRGNKNDGPPDLDEAMAKPTMRTHAHSTAKGACFKPVSRPNY